MKHILRIKSDGSFEFLGSPPPGFAVGVTSKSRFSEILPVNPALRWLFIRLRRAFGEDGIFGEWTRTWPCLWRCEILKGSRKGSSAVSKHRHELISWEKQIWKNLKKVTIESQGTGHQN